MRIHKDINKCICFHVQGKKCLFLNVCFKAPEKSIESALLKASVCKQITVLNDVPGGYKSYNAVSNASISFTDRKSGTLGRWLSRPTPESSGKTWLKFTPCWVPALISPSDAALPCRRGRAVSELFCFLPCGFCQVDFLARQRQKKWMINATCNL